MANKADIVNMALSHLGSGATVSNVDTENSQEARVARLFFDPALETLLTRAWWPFSKKTIQLSLVEENPTMEWAFSYRYPVDCVDIRKIPSGIANPRNDQLIPFDQGMDNQGRLIYTNLPSAQLEYTSSSLSAALFPPNFTTALSYLLAYLMAPRMTGGDPNKLGDKCFNLYEKVWFPRAAAQVGNERQAYPPPESELLAARR